MYNNFIDPLIEKGVVSVEKKGKYAAFISYRHVSPDKEIAKALQMMLEYNLVRPNKDVPRHIRKVFLDTSELPTLEDLDAGILEALDQAECLFVICSPDLPLSKYCLREIEYFKERHGGSLDRVATLLVRGEPGESYPKALTTKWVPDPEDPDRRIEVEVEPLYADVRGKNLLQSLGKLFFSEYLRLAARYYRCTYDELKKRHKRNFRAALACALALVLTVSGVLVAKDQQLRDTKANTYATHAGEQTRKGDELLAMALCTHTNCKATGPYTAALRSALVQFDYKRSSVPVSKMMETTYSHSDLTHCYLSHSGRQLLVADGNNWQVTDAYHGTVIRQFPYESAFVMGKSPKAYVTMTTRPDEAGVFRDYLRLIDLETDQLITEFPFREATDRTPQYHVVSLVESEGWLNMLMDGDQPVAYFTAEGQQLTREEYNRLLQNYTSGQVQEKNDPFTLVRDKLRREYVVKNRDGNVVLSLGSSYENAAFSGDWKQFAFVADGTLFAYETENWTLAGQTELKDSAQSLQLLRNSSYCVVGYRREGGFLGDGTRSVVLDWRSGEELFTTDGTVLISPSEQAFFTVLSGTITRYTYTQLDLTARSEVVAHVENRCLSYGAGEWILRDAGTRQILLRSDSALLRTDENLEHILTAKDGTLICYDGSGREIWRQNGQPVAMAMAPGGDRCAWLDDAGVIHILDTADGGELYQLPAPAVGQVTQILISDRGVGILGSEDSVWIRESDGAEVSLGKFPRGKLFSDGMLILESDARVHDFHLFDTVRQQSVFPFADNTGAWAYAPETGYLARHIESTGNNPGLYLEVWQIGDGKAELRGRIDLPENRVDHLTMDSTGKWLSVGCGGSRVYALKDLSLMLDVGCPVYLEKDAVYGYTVYGSYQYTMPLYDAGQLREAAIDALTGPLGMRTLTGEERKLYEISE